MSPFHDTGPHWSAREGRGAWKEQSPLRPKRPRRSLLGTPGEPTPPLQSTRHLSGRVRRENPCNESTPSKPSIPVPECGPRPGSYPPLVTAGLGARAEQKQTRNIGPMILAESPDVLCPGPRSPVSLPASIQYTRCEVGTTRPFAALGRKTRPRRECPAG